ncbi:MAG: lysophospholipid acyltransferase family protein, partial [Candidatus Aminicenantes bacterium]|nr:lysophospholipid acyltransferase family protein [Candidatus Aminicenantes bacterium]
RRSFVRFGGMLADMVKMQTLRRDRLESLVDLEGGENLRRALEKGRGVLLFTGHFGNWEAGSLAVSRIAPLHVIARKLDNGLLEAELLSLRRRLGARVIHKHRAARPVLEALRRNEVVAIVIDQNVLRREGVFVDFFGRAAGTTPGPAVFHLKSGAPLLPVFSHPRRDGGYVLRLGRPLDVPAAGDTPENVLKITQACTKIIEVRVRDAPESWLWFHDRWRSRPPEEHGEKTAFQRQGP